MLPVVLFVALFSSSTEISEVPAAFVKSAAKCSLEFDNGGVRDIYPEYQIATGERFIAQIDTQSCSVLSREDHAESDCSDGSCSDQATSVVQVNSSTLYFCFSNDAAPEPMVAVLQPDGVYAYNNSSLTDLCLYDASKKSFATVAPSTGLLYIASDSDDESISGYKYHDLATGVSRPVPVWELRGSIDTILGIFTRGDYFYSVYLDGDGKSKITRSCLDDKSDMNRIATFTFASVVCSNSILGTTVSSERVLSLEYSTQHDKLFLLVTQNPVSSAAVDVCVVDVGDIDNVFDTSAYKWLDEDGNTEEDTQDIISCSTEWNYPVLSECVDTIVSTNVILTTLTTDVRWFTLYEVLNYTLLYIASGDTLYIHEYDVDSGSTKVLSIVSLWEDVSSLSIYNELLYLTTSTQVHVTLPYWCSYYGKNPVTCLGSMHPSCSYSTVHSECLPTTECLTDCVQSLENGSFTSVFPDGYTYTVDGTICENKKQYTDVRYIFHSNSSLTTQLSYRDCSTIPPTKEPVINPRSDFTAREWWLLVGMIGFALAFLLTLTVLVTRPGGKVGILNCKDGITAKKHQYGHRRRDDEVAIVSAPATPNTLPPGSGLTLNLGNGDPTYSKQTIISNPASGEAELGTK